MTHVQVIREALLGERSTEEGIQALDSVRRLLQRTERELALANSLKSCQGEMTRREVERVNSLLAYIKQLEGERDAEREKFHRHVEEMIEPKLLARLEAVTRERDEYRDAADGMARAPYGEFQKWANRAEAAEERLEAAQAWYRDHRAEGIYDEAMWGDPFAISPQLRSALARTEGQA